MSLRKGLHAATCDCGDDQNCVRGQHAMMEICVWLQSDEAVMILVNHQRKGIEGCTCGWSDLGRMHPRHVLEKLIEQVERQD